MRTLVLAALLGIAYAGDEISMTTFKVDKEGFMGDAEKAVDAYNHSGERDKLNEKLAHTDFDKMARDPDLNKLTDSAEKYANKLNRTHNIEGWFREQTKDID